MTIGTRRLEAFPNHATVQQRADSADPPYRPVQPIYLEIVMSVANSTNPNSAQYAPPVQGVNQPKAVSKDPVVVPTMREVRRSTEPISPLDTLPGDVKPLILKFSNQAVFNLRLTCTSWNREVRIFLAETPEGKSIVREKYEAQFRDAHRTSALNLFRESYKNEQSFQKISFSDDGYTARMALEDSKTSNAPVYFVPAANGKSITSSAQSALATRSQKLTIIEIDQPIGCKMESVLAALKLIPHNGFVALVINSKLLASENARSLCEAISRHPVVMHIECNGDGSQDAGSQAVEWITLLAKQNANVTSFALNSCGVDELDHEALSKLLSATTGILELEVNESETTSEKVAILADAVGKRNASGDAKLTFHFSAGNLDAVIDAQQRSALSGEGFCVREPGQLWVFQKDPAAEDSHDDDSSIVVGDPSSGDESWGSEFESPAEDSDVVVASSSDDES